MPAPTSVDVQRLNGFINYLANPRKLTRKDTPWEWSAEQQVFETIKKFVTESPVLSYYNTKQERLVQCDASQHGLGAALLQQGKPIAYVSCALTEMERRVCTNRERNACHRFLT